MPTVSIRLPEEDVTTDADLLDEDVLAAWGRSPSHHPHTSSHRLHPGGSWTDH